MISNNFKNNCENNLNKSCYCCFTGLFLKLLSKTFPQFHNSTIPQFHNFTIPKVMGILNMTEDSFSDGGLYVQTHFALERAEAMAAEGAWAIDIGGESTRPGAKRISAEEEWRRIGEAVEALGGNGAVAVSVDTYHLETARRAIEAGVDMINCVYGDEIVEIARLCAENGRLLVAPADEWRRNGALRDAIGLESVYLDPMIGFGTTREEDLKRLKAIGELKKEGKVLVGASRKRIVQTLTGESEPKKTLGGNIAVAVWCAMNGVDVVRVHDVKETCDAMRTIKALKI